MSSSLRASLSCGTASRCLGSNNSWTVHYFVLLFYTLLRSIVLYFWGGRCLVVEACVSVGFGRWWRHLLWVSLIYFAVEKDCCAGAYTKQQGLVGVH